MLNLAGANECTPPEVSPATKDQARYKSSGLKFPRCIWVPVANIAKETQFRVTTVTEQPYGGPGRCWKVEVTLITGESAGITSSIPACHFDFPESERWLRMKSANEYVEPLQISDRVATHGVYGARDNGTPRFHRVKAPDRAELGVLVQRISERVGRCLERLGLLVRDAESAWLNLASPADDDAMTQLLGSSVTYRIAVGPQQGRKAFMLRTLPPSDDPDPTRERVAKVAGFSLHAGVSCEAHQRDKRERLCRYIARPPVSVQRLSVSSHGKVVYTLKTPYRDGTTQIVFEPIDFVARLAALVPKPRVNLTRYHGVLAPNHHWRADITPAGRGKGIRRRRHDEENSPIELHPAMTWAQRLKRVFNIDVDKSAGLPICTAAGCPEGGGYRDVPDATCPRCGGPVKVIACIEDQTVIDKILAHLRDKDQKTPAPPLLVPPPRVPPAHPVLAQPDAALT